MRLIAVASYSLICSHTSNDSTQNSQGVKKLCNFATRISERQSKQSMQKPCKSQSKFIQPLSKATARICLHFGVETANNP